MSRYCWRVNDEPPTRDQLIGANLAKLRGDRSQQWLADAMREAGFDWAQATVWSIEKGKRPIRLAEGEAAARTLGVEVTDLLRVPVALEFFDAKVRFEDAQRVLFESAAEFEVRLGELAHRADAWIDDGQSVQQVTEELEGHRFDISAADIVQLVGRRSGVRGLKYGPFVRQYLGRTDLWMPGAEPFEVESNGIDQATP